MTIVKTMAEAGERTGIPYLEAFVYLQLLDFLTTLAGFRVGAQEASPMIRVLMEAGPVQGLAISKLIAFLLAAFCLWRRRHRVIMWINYWYAGLVLWNIGVILAATRAG